jgi:hypothetical protein
MLLGRYQSALERLRFALKPAIAFDIWATLIFMVSFVPASGWLLNRLVAASGQFAVSDNDLVGDCIHIICGDDLAGEIGCRSAT